MLPHHLKVSSFQQDPKPNDQGGGWRWRSARSRSSWGRCAGAFLSLSSFLSLPTPTPSAALASVKKDLEFYGKELAAQRARVDKLRAAGADEHDVRKQEEVQLETETMLPDCQARLREAAADLRSFLDANRAELQGLETLREADELLAAAQ